MHGYIKLIRETEDIDVEAKKQKEKMGLNVGCVTDASGCGRRPEGAAEGALLLHLRSPAHHLPRPALSVCRRAWARSMGKGVQGGTIFP